MVWRALCWEMYTLGQRLGSQIVTFPRKHCLSKVHATHVPPGFLSSNCRQKNIGISWGCELSSTAPSGQKSIIRPSSHSKNASLLSISVTTSVLRPLRRRDGFLFLLSISTSLWLLSKRFIVFSCRLFYFRVCLNFSHSEQNSGHHNVPRAFETMARRRKHGDIRLVVHM